VLVGWLVGWLVVFCLCIVCVFCSFPCIVSMYMFMFVCLCVESAGFQSVCVCGVGEEPKTSE
jgi:hypothetical protein